MQHITSYFSTSIKKWLHFVVDSKYLYKKGFISIFLDGYDEIKYIKRTEFNDSINNLINFSDNKNIFITSRFDTEIERLSFLTKYQIKPLTVEEYPNFIRCILKNNLNEAHLIIKKLKESIEFNADILTTPLLISWFIMVFRGGKTIPKTKIGFYKELFRTILSTHDGDKGSFYRERKSNLSDEQLEEVLGAFCYLIKNDSVSDMDKERVIHYIKLAINHSNVGNVSPNDYLTDLTKVTCLLVKDGFKYGFIHESVASYFSARFIKNTIEENSNKFYLKADSNWEKWGEELNFLYYIDKYRFHKFMIIPSISQLSEESEEEIFKNKKISVLKKQSIRSIFNDSILSVVLVENKNFIISGFYKPTLSFTCHFIFNGGHYNHCETDKLIHDFIVQSYKGSDFFKEELTSMVKDQDKLKTYYYEFMDVLAKASHIQLFNKFITIKVISKMNQTLKESFDILSKEKSKGDIFSD